MRICPNCGKEFSPFHASSVYCSHSCYLEFSNKRKLVAKAEKKCVICESLFIASRRDIKYCSDECRKKAYSHKRDTSENKCLFCGEMFLPKNTKKQLYCSESCHNKATYQNNKEEIKRRSREWTKNNLKGTPKGRKPREHRIINGEDHALCSKCKRWLTVDNFFKKSTTLDKLTPQCKDCIKEYCYINRDRTSVYLKKYQSDNKEEISKYKSDWASKQGSDYHDRRNEYFAKYREENKDQISAMHKERNQREDVKNKNRVYVLRRRTRIKNLPAEMTPADWVKCLEYFDYKDAYTGNLMDKVSQDHIIPISNGGGYIKNNIVPCENSVNSSKGDKEMVFWFTSQPFFSEERLEKIYKWIDTP